MIRRLRIALLALTVTLAAAAPAAAGIADWISWIEELSGPGPFHGYTVSVDRIVCWAERADGGGPLRRGSAFDRRGPASCLAGNDTREDRLRAYLAVELGWFPTGGYVPFTTDPVEHMKSMVLPVIALGFTSAALPARLVRSSMLDVLSEDYVRTAVAKGLPPRAVAVRHALRSALLPAITVLALRLADLLGGAVIVETVFQIPGMAPSLPNVLGILSLILWALILVVTVKYVLFILRADNRGEGGVLALMSLVTHRLGHGSRRRLFTSARRAKN